MTPAIRAAVEALETILGEQDRTEGYASLAAYDKGRAALSLLREAGERGEPVAWMAVADDGSGYRMFTAEKPTSPRSASGFLFTPLYTSLGDVQVDARRYQWLRDGKRYRQGEAVSGGARQINRDHLRALMTFQFGCSPEELDAAIDEAMSSTPNPIQGEGEETEQPNSNVHRALLDRTARNGDER